MPRELSVLAFVDSAFRPAERAWLEARDERTMFVDPVFRRIEKRSELASRKKFAALSLIEAYGWVLLGVRADAFPRELGSQLLRDSSNSILEANEFAKKERLGDEITPENLRLLNSEVSFPPSFRDTHKPEFLNLPEAPTIFSLWAGEFKSFSRSTSASTFVQMTNFANEHEWPLISAQLADDPFDPEGTQYTQTSLFEGYLRVLQHLDRIADLLDVEGTAEQKWPARAIMRMEVGSIHRWQLNFRSNTFEPRFWQVTEIFETRLRQEAAALGTKLEDRLFDTGVRDLVRRYVAAQEPLQAWKNA
jgi:hypothetical protein